MNVLDDPLELESSLVSTGHFLVQFAVSTASLEVENPSADSETLMGFLIKNAVAKQLKLVSASALFENGLWR